MKKFLYISLIIFWGGLLFFASTNSVSAQISITSQSPLPRGAQNQAYTFQFQASGAQSYAWQAFGWTPRTGAVNICGIGTTGDIPQGISLNPNGLLSGTPTQAGSFGFMVVVNDDFAKKTGFCITIDPSPDITTPVTPPAPTPAAPTPPPSVNQPRAACPTGLVPCGTAGCPCGFCDFFVLTNNLIRWTFTWAIPTIAILMLIIGGVLLFFAGAKSDTVNQAKGIITSVIVGLLIIFSAWVIINTVFDKIGIVDMPSGWKWYKIGCAP